MTISKKVMLITGDGFAHVPLILTAKRLDFHVVTRGNRPAGLGHAYADDYRLADYSDPDAILDLARAVQADAVCACCNDFAALSAADVAEQMGLPGHDPLAVAEIIHDNDRYRAFAQENGVRSPQAGGFDDIDAARAAVENFPLPLMVKPVDLTGGKGISAVHTVAEAHDALEQAFAISKAGRVVVEEFVTGTRHGFSLFLRDQKAVFWFADNEFYFLDPYLVSAASAPGSVTESAQSKMIAESEHIARLLNLCDGLFHIQFILHKSESVMIEITRRASGDLYLRSVQNATGVDYPDWIVRAVAGTIARTLNRFQFADFTFVIA